MPAALAAGGRRGRARDRCNFATLALAGRPWGITSAFALWGSKIADGIGIEDWRLALLVGAGAQAELEGSVFNDVTSVMDFGIIVGALLAAALAGRFAPTWRVPLRSALAAVIGGLLLGYGARLAYGCNIGAYFSGIASGSLHGWVWLVFAFGGNVIGTSAPALRPRGRAHPAAHRLLSPLFSSPFRPALPPRRLLFALSRPLNFSSLPSGRR